MKCIRKKKRTVQSESFLHLLDWMKKKKPHTHEHLMKKNPSSTDDNLFKMFTVIKKIDDVHSQLLKRKENIIDWRKMVSRLDQPSSFFRDYFNIERKKLQNTMHSIRSKRHLLTSNAGFILTSLERCSNTIEYEDYLDDLAGIFSEDPALLFKQRSLLARLRRSYFRTDYQLSESEYVSNYFHTHLAPLVFEEISEEVIDVQEELIVDWIPNLQEVIDFLRHGPVDTEKKLVWIALLAMSSLPKGLYHALVSQMFERRDHTESIHHTWNVMFSSLLSISSSRSHTLEYDLVFQIAVSGFAYCLSLAVEVDGKLFSELFDTPIFTILINHGKPVKDSLSVVETLFRDVKCKFT